MMHLLRTDWAISGDVVERGAQEKTSESSTARTATGRASQAPWERDGNAKVTTRWDPS